MFFISEAFAQQATAAAPTGIAGILQSPLMMMLAIFLIFYFILIRPQQRQQKERKDMIANLKFGDTVLTTSGMYGKIIGVSDQTVTIEVADNIKIKFARDAVANLSTPNPAKKPEKK